MKHCLPFALLCCLTCLAGLLPAQTREKLGPAINTEAYDESAPLFSADGRTLYFWSLNRSDGQGLQDIYVSRADAEGVWEPALNIGPPLNDPNCNIAFSITPDGNRMLVYRRNSKPGQSDLAISRRHPGDIWGAPEALRFEKYSNAGESSLSAYLAANGKTLILSIIAPGGRGAEDLHVSFYNNKTRTWSEPRNLGPILNTAGAEVTPFMASDGITLYYSTNTPGGAGGQDIYMTRRLDDSWLNWSRPVNLGAMVNTPGDDYYFKFPLDATYGYFVSTHGGSTKDIYRVRLPQHLRPMPVMLVRGRVIDQQSNQPIQASITYQELPSGNEVGIAQTDTSTGEYQILLPSGRMYGFNAQAYGYMAVSENLDVKVNAGVQYETVTRDLKMAPMQVGQVIRLNNLFFNTGSAELLPGSLPELQRFVSLMNAYPKLMVELSGHTDDTGSTEINLELSEKRAQAVLSYLQTQNINPTRLFVKGYGSFVPLAPNDTDANRQLNRRVEIKILGL